MAGEPILIVDDTPVNLKLTRILLVNEGYSVVTAASAEEALELLRTYHPRLVLADIQLPGMDGLEMTRQIKRNERTRDILVVALTAFAMKGDEQRAREAGCDGYITKPIDTRSLGLCIRKLLDQRADTLAPEAAHEPLAIPTEELQALRRRFLQEGQERGRQLLLELDGAFQPSMAGRVIHQWIGAGGLLGYTAISRLSREVESLLQERPVDTAQVRESLTSLLLAFSTPREATNTPVPEAVVQALGGKVMAIAGLPAQEAQRLCVALEWVRARATCFDSGAPVDAAALEQCDLLVAYIPPGGSDSSWLNALLAAGLPAVFMGSREDLAGLAPDVQARAREILIDSWQPEEALVRLCLAITRPLAGARPAPESNGAIHVLAADDDAAGLALLRTTLQNCGMECHLAGDGRKALQELRRLRPQAAVLHVDLPGMDAYSVLAALRAENLPVRVLLLTARRQESDVLRGYAAGADDYLVKPFSPLELVARLRRLLAR